MLCLPALCLPAGPYSAWHTQMSGLMSRLGMLRQHCVMRGNTVTMEGLVCVTYVAMVNYQGSDVSLTRKNIRCSFGEEECGAVVE